ncbi:MAG TPA: BamA/TamA family outer membrane protein [Bacteroidia bacterium]|jgi:outer membrane protein assembly factor BamA|nr:BamA/TamA family outer membrane protein [Bacteroidia bacterium]
MVGRQSIVRHIAKFILACFFLVSSHASIASPADTSKTAKKDKLRIRPVPVISYAPETRFLFGVGALGTFQLCKDTSTHYSLVAVFVAYTQNNQDYIYIPYQFYTKNNTYYIEGEADYYNYSYYYWGIGTNRVPKELYNVRFPRILANGYRKIAGNFYAGIDYYLESDVIPWKQPGGELSKGTILGSKGSVSSGVGIDFQYDTRDSIYFPSRGWYIKGTSYFNTPLLGASGNFQRVITDVSYYTKLAKPLILALNEHTQLCWGDVPFNQLSLVGGSKGMRGYYLGYYRDDYLTYFQAEARLHLFWRIGLDAFGEVGLLGNNKVFPESNSPIFAEGLGLRYNYDYRQHVNVRLDVGYGTSIEFYLTIQEGF